MRKSTLAVSGVLAVAIVVGSGVGGAYAKSLITGADIKDGTVTGADIKNGTHWWRHQNRRSPSTPSRAPRAQRAPRARREPRAPTARRRRGVRSGRARRRRRQRCRGHWPRARHGTEGAEPARTARTPRTSGGHLGRRAPQRRGQRFSRRGSTQAPPMGQGALNLRTGSGADHLPSVRRRTSAARTCRTCPRSATRCSPRVRTSPSVRASPTCRRSLSRSTPTWSGLATTPPGLLAGQEPAPGEWKRSSQERPGQELGPHRRVFKVRELSGSTASGTFARSSRP